MRQRLAYFLARASLRLMDTACYLGADKGRPLESTTSPVPMPGDPIDVYDASESDGVCILVKDDLGRVHVLEDLEAKA